MKKHIYLWLCVALLLMGFTDSRPIHNSKKPAGTFTFERKGKTYSASETSGNIIMPPNKKGIYFLVNAMLTVDGKTINLIIHFRNQDELVTGKAYTLVGKLGTDNQKPRHISYMENIDQDEDGSKAISCGSDVGTLTLTTLTIADKKAIVSGKFEFKGKNDNDSPNAEKEIAVKGNFNNLEIRYISAAMFKP